MLLIPNEDMPSKCEECPCYDPYVYLCHVVDEDEYNGRVIDTHGARQAWCPLIEIKEPDCETVIVKTTKPKFMEEDE